MPVKVLIAIQARSGSKRLPRKAFELIGNKMMLDHVIHAAKSAARYISKFSEKSGVTADAVVVTPYNDPIVAAFRTRCPVVQGPEQDVLTRYLIAAGEYKPDYIVRVTGDCPLLPDFIITKLVKTSVINGYDYLSNVDEEARTAIDGHDCEVISTKLLEYVGEAATDPYDREHVTTLARRSPPEWAKIGCVINYLDQSDIKLSVDTEEDLRAVREQHERRDSKFLFAERKFGRHSVHRL